MLRNDTERPPAKDPVFLTFLTTFLVAASDSILSLITTGAEVNKRSVVIALLTALGMTLRAFHNEVRMGLRIFDGADSGPSSAPSTGVPNGPAPPADAEKKNG